MSDPEEAPGEVYPTVVGLWGEEPLPDRYYGYYQPVEPSNIVFEGPVPAGKEEFFVLANFVNCPTSVGSGSEYAFTYQGAWTWTVEPINGAEANGGVPIVQVNSSPSPSGTISAQLSLGAGATLSTVQWYFLPDTVVERSYVEGGAALRAALRLGTRMSAMGPQTRLELIRSFRLSRMSRRTVPALMALRAPPQSIASCAGLMACDIPTPVPGAALAVVTLTDGRTFADAARSGAAQPVSASCTPATVRRGDMVSCVARLTTPQPFTVIRRQARGSGFTVEDLTPVQYAAGDTAVWSGPAVATSGVEFSVVMTNQGQADTLTTLPDSFTVTPRAWPAWAFQNRVASFVALYGNKMVPYPTLGSVVGQFVPELPPATGITITRPTGGPNAGVAFVGTPYVVTEFSINIHPALDLAAYSPTLPGYAGAQQWVTDQNGTGSGTCSQSHIPTLRAAVAQHEGGVPVASNSHPGVANQVFAQQNPQTIVERLYTQGSDATLVATVGSTVQAFFASQAYTTAQHTFDVTDGPIVFGSAGCTFDFNPNDN